jgi:hypothetical protein
MLAIRTILIAGLAISPIAATAAELPVTGLHSTHVIHVHRYAPRVHVGYYWGRTGARWGGTAGYWYSSDFAFAGAPGWNAGAAAGPRSAAALACYLRPPTVCLEQPVVRPIALLAPPPWH